MRFPEDLRSGLVTSGPEETEDLGKQIAQALPPDCALGLVGDLGCGKTTFVRGLARGLGIRSTVTSPTYTLYNMYEGKRQLLHLDAYRLGSEEAAEALLLEEFLASPFLLAVEWADRIPQFLCSWPAWWLRLSIEKPGHHEIHLLDPPDGSAESH